MERVTARPSQGAGWYFSLISVGLAILLLAQARSTEFRHGEELAWLVAYAVPAGFALLALFPAVYNLVRGRLRSLLSWIPVLAALAMLVWLFAYIFLDAWRSPCIPRKLSVQR